MAEQGSTALGYLQPTLKLGGGDFEMVEYGGESRSMAPWSHGKQERTKARKEKAEEE